MNNISHQIKLQEIKLKIIDQIQSEGNLRQLSSGNSRDNITFEFKDFQEAWEKFPNEHKHFTWLDLVNMYNGLHEEIKTHYGNS